jgi:hypothetical protein
VPASTKGAFVIVTSIVSFMAIHDPLFEEVRINCKLPDAVSAAEVIYFAFKELLSGIKMLNQKADPVLCFIKNIKVKTG